MPARDIYHHQVRQALIKDGWTITHDPLRLSWGRKDVYVDLGAERLLAAEKGSQRIAVKIKSFLGASDMQDLEHALGQFVLYRTLLAQREPNRILYLAVPHFVVRTIFEQPIGELLLHQGIVQVLGFDPITAEVKQWLPTTPTALS